MTRKKSLIETVDALFLADLAEVQRGIEATDRMFESDLNDLKKWGRPVLYDDDFHRRKRESMKRLRSR